MGNVMKKMNQKKFEKIKHVLHQPQEKCPLIYTCGRFLKQ